jgi:hypothetical protein
VGRRRVSPRTSTGTDAKKVWFAGDTGHRTVFDDKKEEDVPVCPAFAEISQQSGPFDLAYDSDWVSRNLHVIRVIGNLVTDARHRAYNPR